MEKVAGIRCVWILVWLSRKKYRTSFLLFPTISADYRRKFWWCGGDSATPCNAVKIVTGGAPVHQLPLGSCIAGLVLDLRASQDHACAD